MKAVRRHIQASRDIDQTLAYYLDNAPEGVAERFLTALELALAHISQRPGTGSARYASATDIAGLRFWTLQRFPFAVFYVEQPDHIAVLRVLHQTADLPRHFT